jgi:hypothetical protein
METQLSDKYTKLELQAFHCGDSVNAMIKINQLITYLAELTEVVECKATYREGYEQGRFDAEMDGANLEFKQVTPSLKEQLLKEINEKKIKPQYLDTPESIWGQKQSVWNQALSDVEAIINRLIP